MLGLRLVEEGVSFERFAARYDTSLADAFGDELTRLTEWGLLESDLGASAIDRTRPHGGQPGFCPFSAGLMTR